MSKVVHYSGEDFEKDTILSEGVTLVDFYAVWCGPCQMLSPILDDLSENSYCKIVKFDTDIYSELPSKFKIRSLPTMIIFKDGKQVCTLTGFLEKKEIEQKIKEYK
ncbi:MAG: thioredoxin [Leptotrichiaceae bacterium]|nr:thioredoxin [Leptotrichiaceae bacterium]